MSAVPRTDLQVISRRVDPLAPARRTTRYTSTFVRPIAQGATWIYSEPDGSVWMVRVDPRRVIKDLQQAAGADVDAQYGPQAKSKLAEYTGLAPTAPDRDLFEAALLRFYGHGQGTLVLPDAVELPNSQARPVPVIQGPETGFRRLNLVSGRVEEAPAASPGTPPAPAPVQATEADSVPADARDAAITATSAATGTPPAADGQPQAPPAQHQTGMIVSGAPSGTTITATPISGTAEAPGAPTGQSLQLQTDPGGSSNLGAILLPGLYRAAAVTGTSVRTAYYLALEGVAATIAFDQFSTTTDQGEKCRVFCANHDTQSIRATGCSCSIEEEATPAPVTAAPVQSEVVQAGMSGFGKLFLVSALIGAGWFGWDALKESRR